MCSLVETNNSFDLERRTTKNRHGFLDVYENYFSPLRNNKINLLEIGLWAGDSIRLWEKYFINANIFGIEKDPTCLSIKFDKASIDVVDAGNKIELINYACDKNFDIIIDDASHYPLHQILSFQILFERLNSGGLYIIEDLHVGYQEAFVCCRGWTMAFLSNLLHFLNFRGKVKFLSEYKTENHICFGYDGRFEFIHFYPGLVIIKKK